MADNDKNYCHCPGISTPFFVLAIIAVPLCFGLGYITAYFTYKRKYNAAVFLLETMKIDYRARQAALDLREANLAIVERLQAPAPGAQA